MLSQTAGITRRISGGAAVRCIRWFCCERHQVFLRENMTQDNANHDAVPAAIAPVDRLVRLGATDRESVGTDKAEPLTRDCGTGNTNARLEALEELSALDQKLELEYGLTGNPLIKAGRHTPPPQTTPGECSRPQEGT